MIFLFFNVGKHPSGIKSKDFARSCAFLAESIKTSNLDSTVAISNVKVLLPLNFDVTFSMDCFNIIQGEKKRSSPGKQKRFGYLLVSIL